MFIYLLTYNLDMKWNLRISFFDISFLLNKTELK